MRQKCFRKMSLKKRAQRNREIPFLSERGVKSTESRGQLKSTCTAALFGKMEEREKQCLIYKRS